MSGPADLENYSSHDAFSHDSISSLGYDWSRVANQKAVPAPPLAVFLPKGTDDVSRIFRLLAALGSAGQDAENFAPDRVKIRSKGHSSNDLVLGDVVICTELMSDVSALTVDTTGAIETVKVPAGATLGSIDQALGLGPKPRCLPVVGDHAHITAGGFASVGGMGAASHIYGMFVDNVLAVTLVDRQGIKHEFKTSDPDQLDPVLAGLGRKGVITDLTVRVIDGNRRTDVREAKNNIVLDFDKFVLGTGDQWERAINTENATHQRAAWLHGHAGSADLQLGNIVYYVRPNLPAPALTNVAGALSIPLKIVGSMAGRTPDMEDMLRPAGLFGLMFCPPYSLVADIESFTDMAIDTSGGPPMRMLSLVCASSSYETMIRSIAPIYEALFAQGHIVQWLVTTKVIKSEYLNRRAKNADTFRELTFYCWSPLDKSLDVVQVNGRTVLDLLVNEFDGKCTSEINARGKPVVFRYMHTRTSTSPFENTSKSKELDFNRR